MTAAVSLRTSTIYFDGMAYTVLRSEWCPQDGLTPSVPHNAVRVIASRQTMDRFASHFLVGTFRPDGRPFGAVSRPPYVCCAWGEYDNKPCVHQNWRK
jgi:hypothetical protein